MIPKLDLPNWNLEILLCELIAGSFKPEILCKLTDMKEVTHEFSSLKILHFIFLRGFYSECEEGLSPIRSTYYSDRYDFFSY